MAVEIVMPRMGQSMEEGRIVRWLKPPGAAVQRGEALVEIETDKANIEVEAGVSGRLAAILAPEDTIVAVGAAIAVLEEGNTPPAPAAAPAGGDASARRPRVPASPLARRLAAEYGVDLRDLRGTGPGGRVGKFDVLAFVAKRSSPAPSPAARHQDLPSPETAVQAPAAAEVEPPVAAAPARRVPLTKMRRTVGQRMAASKSAIPHFYLTVDLDMRQALALHASLAARGREVSLTALLLRAAALALVEHPQLNARLEDDAIVYSGQVDLAVAVALDDGLITPVVPNCQALSLEALAQAVQAVIERARSGRPQPQDLGAGTFTVSNLGMFGVKQFEAIINPPHAAILALGAIRRVPVFDAHDNVVAAQLLTATLSADHRIVDGAAAARFLNTLQQLLADGFALL